MFTPTATLRSKSSIKRFLGAGAKHSDDLIHALNIDIVMNSKRQPVFPAHKDQLRMFEQHFI